jgi:hypothetical protein
MQEYAITHPLARAEGDAQVFRELRMPWSVMLTVNK